VHIAVEPDLAEGHAQLLALAQQVERTADVIHVDVCHDEKFEMPIARGQIEDALTHCRKDRTRTAVDQDAMRSRGDAVLHPDRVAELGWEQVDAKHFRCPFARFTGASPRRRRR
jgi:hypothetical protein